MSGIDILAGLVVAFGAGWYFCDMRRDAQDYERRRLEQEDSIPEEQRRREYEQKELRRAVARARKNSL